MRCGLIKSVKRDIGAVAKPNYPKSDDRSDLTYSPKGVNLYPQQRWLTPMTLIITNPVGLMS